VIVGMEGIFPFPNIFLIANYLVPSNILMVETNYLINIEVLFVVFHQIKTRLKTKV
jgi:hypothetical protein